jgi:hypothetical protein
MAYFRRFITVGFGLSLLVLAWAWPGGQAMANQRTRGMGSQDMQGRGVALIATLSPSVPTDPPIFGVGPGSVPWQIAHGHVVLTKSGGLEANVAGLVVTTTGSNPVPFLAASVYCNGALAAMTAPVPFSPQGNAHIHAMVSLPAFCPAPAVLLNPATAPTTVLPAYISFDGTT